MTRSWIRLQTGVLALVALMVIASLVLSGAHGRTIREAAYDFSGINPLVRVTAGGQLCEAPVTADGKFGRLVFWSNGGGKALVSVRQWIGSNAPVLALGILQSGAAGPGENVVHLTQPVTPSPGMSVCVKSQRGATVLYGGPAQYLSNFSGGTYGAPVIIGFHPESTLWLQAWSPRQHGIWSSLSLAFRRMSLFRLSWIGTWTFWVLLCGVFAGFPLLVMAVWLALKAEQRTDDGTSPK